MKDKKKGFQRLAIIAESLETPDFRPFEAYYLSFRDINTTVSTWTEWSVWINFNILSKRRM